MTKKEILFVLIDDFADWEFAYLASFLNSDDEEHLFGDYIVKTVGVDNNKTFSIGGLHVTTDYTIAQLPKDFYGLVLIGGRTWRTPNKNIVKALVDIALEKQVPLGAICDGCSFLAKHSYLNKVKHTANSLESIAEYAGDNYTNEDNFQLVDAFCENNIVTANGSAPLEFAKLYLTCLEPSSKQSIEQWYQFNKLGYCHFVEKYAPPM